MIETPNCYLDRDGVINHSLPYVGTLERFYWHKEIFEIMKYFSVNGYRLVMVTNQSGIARGYYSLEQFNHLNNYILDSFQKEGLSVEIRFCPHHPDAQCACRKPNTAMLDIDIRTPRDVLIGDQITDIRAAYRSKVLNRWLISSDNEIEMATRVAKDHQHLLENYIYWYKNDLL